MLAFFCKYSDGAGDPELHKFLCSKNMPEREAHNENPALQQ
jgi:hypothetical protein